MNAEKKEMNCSVNLSEVAMYTKFQQKSFVL